MRHHDPKENHGELAGGVAVITGGATGMAPAGARLFVEQGAYVTGRHQEVLDEAVRLIGRNVTGVLVTDGGTTAI